MDLALIGATPIANVAAPAERQRVSSDAFGAVMATQADDGATTVERAEAMIGGRIRAPEGGCGCDAFVADVAPQATPATRPTPATPPAPGDVLLVRDKNPLSEHMHQAIMRSATEMIAANESGLIEVLSIPWDRVGQRTINESAEAYSFSTRSSASSSQNH